MIGIQTSASGHEVSAAITSITLTRQSIEISVSIKKAVEVGADKLIANFELADGDYENAKKYIELIVAGSNIGFTSRTADDGML